MTTKTVNKAYIGNHISLQELFVLYRRRFKLNQDQFGKMFNVSQATVAAWENGKLTRQSQRFLAVKSFLEFHYREEILDELRDEEVCYILRNRLGLTQEYVAGLLGVTRVWHNRIEQGLEQKRLPELLDLMIELNEINNEFHRQGQE